MQELLLDTDIRSEFFKGRNRTVDANASAYLAVHPKLRFSLVSRIEVLRGLMQKGATAQLAKFGSLYRDSITLGVDNSVVDRAAQLWADAFNAGLPRRSADLVIAATALEYGLPLCTGNTTHFDWVPGLRLATWRLP